MIYAAPLRAERTTRQLASAKTRWALLFFLLPVAALYLTSSVAPVIFDETEGQYAGAAREMLQSGDWLVPTNDGIPRLQKPPLLYWLLCLSLGALGPTEFAARLPNALATIGWIWVVYLLGERVGGTKRGLAAAGIFASMIGFFIFSHLIMPEPFLGLFISLTFWCFLSAFRQPQHAGRWFLAAWFFMALGVMTKGLHGALYPLLVALLSALFYPNTRRLWRGLWSWHGLGLLMAMVVPWYVAIAKLFPGFLTEHFVNEQLGHLFNKRFPPDSEPVPLGIFCAQHLLFFFPWTLFAPAALWSWRHQSGEAQGQRAAGRMLALWAALTAGSVIFSARQDYYTLTAWGVVAIWLALPWASERRIPRPYLVVPCLLLVLLGGVGAFWAEQCSRTAFASSIAAEPVAARGGFFTSLTGFSFGAWGECLTLMKWGCLALIAGGAAGALLAFRNRKMAMGVVMFVMMAFCFGIVTRGYALMGQYFSLADVAQAISKAAPLDSLVVCENEPHWNASLFFYLPRRVHWICARPDNEFALRSLHLGSELYLSDDQLIARWRSSRAVYLIIESSNLPGWEKKLDLTSSQAIPFAHSGTRIVIVNHR